MIAHFFHITWDGKGDCAHLGGPFGLSMKLMITSLERAASARLAIETLVVDIASVEYVRKLVDIQVWHSGKYGR